MRSRDQAMDREDADVRCESPRADAVNGGDDRGTPAPPRRGAVYVDEAIWEWRGPKRAPPLPHRTDDPPRFAAPPRNPPTAYPGPPPPPAPPYDPPALPPPP